jgi:uroporphyrinogen-III decarboxylase
LFVQAWTAFGMDAVVWFTGVDGAVTMSMLEPEVFQKMINIIEATDYERTEIAAKTKGIDMVCQRGWYSSTDFWSPELFDIYVFPGLERLTALAHKYGKKFGYVMTTGVETLGPRLADAGVDLLFFVDPVQDRLPLVKARELFGNRMTMVGGMNSISLASDNAGEIRRKVKEAIDILGPTNRFILHPVDAIFPDTPWKGVEAMINAWKEFQ